MTEQRKPREFWLINDGPMKYRGCYVKDITKKTPVCIGCEVIHVREVMSDCSPECSTYNVECEHLGKLCEKIGAVTSCCYDAEDLRSLIHRHVEEQKERFDSLMEFLKELANSPDVPAHIVKAIEIRYTRNI